METLYKFIFEDGYCIIAHKLSKEEKRQEMFIHGRLVSVKKQYGNGVRMFQYVDAMQAINTICIVLLAISVILIVFKMNSRKHK